MNQAGAALGDNVSRDERRQIIKQLNAGDRILLDQKVAELNSRGVNITLPDESKIRYYPDKRLR